MYSADIHPAYRGKGYGSRFLKFAVDWAKENGFGESYVPTHKDNIAACRVYEKVGMEHDGKDCKEYFIKY